MQVSAFQSRVCRSAAALAALLALGLFAPRALAGCGDYVTTGTHHAESVRPDSEHHAVVSVRRQQSTNELGPLMSESPVRHVNYGPAPCRQCPVTPGQTPCRGPWCSGSHNPLSVPLT